MLSLIMEVMAVMVVYLMSGEHAELLSQSCEVNHP